MYFCVAPPKQTAIYKKKNLVFRGFQFCRKQPKQTSVLRCETRRVKTLTEEVNAAQGRLADAAARGEMDWLDGKNPQRKWQFHHSFIIDPMDS